MQEFFEQILHTGLPNTINQPTQAVTRPTRNDKLVTPIEPGTPHGKYRISHASQSAEDVRTLGQCAKHFSYNLQFANLSL